MKKITQYAGMLSITLLFTVASSVNALDLLVPEAKMPAKKNLHLYLMIGQSNMAGRGKIDTSISNFDHQILSFKTDNKWRYAMDPLDAGSRGGVGPGLSFARAMLKKNKGITIGLIPCATGGSRLEYWEQGGKFSKLSLKRINKAMKSGILKGIIWHQGESDCERSCKESVKTYNKRLLQTFRSLRTALGMKNIPIVVGTIGDFISKRVFPYAPLVNKAILDLPKKLPNSAAVNNADLIHKGDHLHFDTPSQRKMGITYAEAMLKLQAQSAK